MYDVVTEQQKGFTWLTLTHSAEDTLQGAVDRIAREVGFNAGHGYATAWRIEGPNNLVLQSRVAFIRQ